MGFDDDKIEMGVTLNKAETKVLKQMLLQTWHTRGCMTFQELLGMEDETEDWLNDVVTEMTEKCEITPEETW